jgi:hypothetical protein
MPTPCNGWAPPGFQSRTEGRDRRFGTSDIWGNWSPLPREPSQPNVIARQYSRAPLPWQPTVTCLSSSRRKFRETNLVANLKQTVDVIERGSIGAMLLVRVGVTAMNRWPRVTIAGLALSIALAGGATVAVLAATSGGDDENPLAGGSFWFWGGSSAQY